MLSELKYLWPRVSFFTPICAMFNLPSFLLSTREKIMTTPRKEMKREKRREDKALIPAELEKVVEQFRLVVLMQFMCTWRKRCC